MPGFLLVKKTAFILSLVMLFVLIMLAAGWYSLNHYIIPQIIVPEIQRRIAEFNRVHGTNLKIKEIHFTIPQGFKLKGIELQPLFSASEVDIDLDYQALLARQVHLTDLKIFAAQLRISRSPRGEWNFTPALQAAFNKKQGKKPTGILLDQVRFYRGQLFFTDHWQRGNQLTRHFQDINITVRNLNGNDYDITASGADPQRQDAIRLELKYQEKTGRLGGKAWLKLANLADYRNYYLDDLLHPWQIGKMKLIAQAEFTYQKGDYSLQGKYAFTTAKINYGDIKLGANGLIYHRQKYLQLKPQQNLLSVEAELNELAVQFNKSSILEKGEAVVAVNGNSLIIKQIKGVSQGKPLAVQGKFKLAWPRQLDLRGKVGQADNTLCLKMISQNQAQVDWLASVESSFLRTSVSMVDLKKLLFNGRVAGRIDLARLPGRLEVDLQEDRLTISTEAAKSDLSGQISFSGQLRGKLDQPESLTGRLGLQFTDFSVRGLEPLSFLMGMKVAQGVFSSGIPPMHLYQGDLSGAVLLDNQRWGIELNLQNADLAKFAKVNSQLAGLKGLLSGKIACLGSWEALDSIQGGGTFKLTDADLKSAPIFANAQQGVGSVVNNFQMPDFQQVNSDFTIANSTANFTNVRAKAPNLELRGAGTINFAGQANFTMGVRLMQKKDVQTAFLIIFPLQTIGFDYLTKAVKVDIKGTLPDLKQTTTIQPLAWLAKTYDQPGTFDPDQYSLEKLWP